MPVSCALQCMAYVGIAWWGMVEWRTPILTTPALLTPAPSPPPLKVTMVGSVIKDKANLIMQKLKKTEVQQNDVHDRTAAAADHFECHVTPAVPQDDVDMNLLHQIWEREKVPKTTVYEADMSPTGADPVAGFKGLSYTVKPPGDAIVPYRAPYSTPPRGSSSGSRGGSRQDSRGGSGGSGGYR